jgi:hypothetical protein
MWLHTASSSTWRKLRVDGPKLHLHHGLTLRVVEATTEERRLGGEKRLMELPHSLVLFGAYADGGDVAVQKASLVVSD